ncbi:MAG: amidohydrolase [Actinomycetales bacterium]
MSGQAQVASSRSGSEDMQQAGQEAIAEYVGHLEPELVALRRSIHEHPELGNAEVRTTALIRDRLLAAGLDPQPLPTGTGLVCDVGDTTGPVVALRADIDALPVQEDDNGLPFRSQVPKVAHMCGHDVHTAVVLGAGLALARLCERGLLAGGVRLVFQPAEEKMPGGAETVVDSGALVGVDRVLAVHCDPRLEVGRVGLRVGAITAAADMLRVTLTGRGGHTARPHLTADLVYALGAVVTQVPALLSRRVDPRAGMSLVWGMVAAGEAPNAIPDRGQAAGTVRCLQTEAWAEAPALVTTMVQEAAAPFGVEVDVAYQRGVPPVVNDAAAISALHDVAVAAWGQRSVARAEQSLGGEDFAWYLEHVPGALARLGARREGDAVERDLHQATFQADERAIAIGARLLGGAALLSLEELGAESAAAR